jgi:hypothetical protein
MSPHAQAIENEINNNRQSVVPDLKLWDTMILDVVLLSPGY